VTAGVICERVGRQIREADDIRRRALAAQHHAAAVAALTVKAKLAGYWVERIQSEAVNVN
jgi:hypothetical protein